MNAQRTPVPDEFRQRPRKATVRQIDFIESLLSKKDLSGVDPARVEGLKKSCRIARDPEEYGLPMDQASKVIEWLLAREDVKTPTKASSGSAGVKDSDVPDGYYALRNVEGHANEISFYRLRSPKNGRWVGWQFCDQVVGHGKRYPVRGAARDAIYALIKEQGIDEARQLFGQEIGSCGRCGRELTDDTSRRRGIGPDCWGLMGL